MVPGLTTSLYGAIGGGLAAAILRLLEQYGLAPHFVARQEARKKLLLYARPLYRSCWYASYRLNDVSRRLESDHYVPQLTSWRRDRTSVDWLTKEGYFVVSSAYLIAAVACWITVFERDVVFLTLRRESLTERFFHLIEELKETMSTGTILYFHYVEGIGDRLTEDGLPMPLSAFVQKLATDQLFCDYYDQLFQFLRTVGEGQSDSAVNKIIECLERIQQFLQDNIKVPDVRPIAERASERASARGAA